MPTRPKLRMLRPTVREIDTRTVKVDPRANHNFYQSPEWRAFTRRIVAVRERVCQDCGRHVPAPARIHCDHVQELTDGGPAFDPANIRLRCTPCHTAKTTAAARERMGRGA